VDTAAFRRVPEADIQAVRDQYELHDRFVIGYIGNHGWWAGMDLLLEAFRRVRERIPHSLLMVVGPGEALAAHREAAADNPAIRFTGPVNPKAVAAYFHAADIGVLPFQISPFTDNALPLKILEYGAARKKVLATPLKELKTLAFPHVELLEPDAAAWADRLAAEAMQPSPWQGDWDSVIESYDWQVVLRDLDHLLENRHAPAV
jgi:glycosyltransferase involved in cell wall biosynthesis